MKYIVDRETVYLLSKGAIDGWGIGQAEETKTPVKCQIRNSEETTGISSIGGKQVIPKYTIYVNGKTPIKVGDLLEIDGEKKEVLYKKEIKDLSSIVIYSKMTV